jgi:tRNA(Ile2) C34 agmatinyltransferase TiaS
MENIQLFHGEAISSCEIKVAKKNSNGKIQVGKVIPVKPEDVQVKKFCPWDCSEVTISVNGICTVCGGTTN